MITMADDYERVILIWISGYNVELVNSASIPDEKFELLREVGRVANKCVNVWLSVRVNQASSIFILKIYPNILYHVTYT